MFITILLSCALDPGTAGPLHCLYGHLPAQCPHERRQQPRERTDLGSSHQNVLIATALLPDKVQEIESRIVREFEEIIIYWRDEEEAGDYFDLLDDTPVTGRQDDLRDELVQTLDGWQRAHSKKLIVKDFFPSYHRETWVELFIKYNTPLPSSAAVERIFSSTEDILGIKRSSLTVSNFEELLFMRSNIELLRFKKEEDRL